MFKGIALVGLLCSGGLLGVMKSRELKERIELLDDFMQMILGIRGYINYFHEPLITIHNGRGENRRSKAFEMFDIIRTELSLKNAEIVEIWAQNVNEYYGQTCLTEEDLELLIYPGSFIGQTDYENQLARFDYLEKRLNEQIERARDIYIKQGPLYRKLGFFAGGLAAIIFI